MCSYPHANPRLARRRDVCIEQEVEHCGGAIHALVASPPAKAPQQQQQQQQGGEEAVAELAFALGAPFLDRLLASLPLRGVSEARVVEAEAGAPHRGPSHSQSGM